jgi:hypothetical protein
VRIVDADTGRVLDPDALTALEPPSSPVKTVLRTIGAGSFAEPVLSPDNRWLVAGWPDADQFVFVRVGGGRRIQAVSNVSSQFRSRTFPRVEGWCCTR